MRQDITLDVRKRETSFGRAKLLPLRRGEKGNRELVVSIEEDGRAYDLSGKTASLVATTAAGKLVGPYPMEAAEAGIARIVLPAALYSAVGAFSGYIEIREGETLVDTTDSFVGNVLDCIDADGEQAEEYTPLLGELQDAIAAARASEVRGATAVTLDTGSPATAIFRDNIIEIGVPKGERGAKGDRGEKGDPFTYNDFTESQIAELQRPATEAATLAKQAIAEVKATEAKLYPVAENILVGSETGAVAHVEDAFAGAALYKITVEGACKQDGTPSPEAPVPIQVVENPIFKAAGKNLLSPSKMAKTWINYVDADGELQVKYGDGRAWAAIPEYGVLPAGVYYICGDAIEVRRASDNVTLAYTQGNVAGFKLDTATSVAIKVGFAHPDSQYPYVSHAMLLASSRKDVAYAPYTSQSLTFTLPAEHPYLAKLPDGTADEIVVDKDGNVELVARVMKTVLDGSQLFYDVNIDGIETYYELSKPIGSGKLPAVQWGGLYDRFVTSNPYTVHQGACAYCFSVSNGVIFRIRPSETFASAEGFNNWLKSNPVTSYHANTEPKTYPLGKIEMPKTQDSIINVWTDAEVTPKTGIGYVRDVNIVVSNIESAIASITEG